MQCPQCAYQPLPENARYCPQCSQPVEVAARIQIDQRLGENYGKVIGVETQVLNGDIYGGDIYQVQVYVLSEAGRSGGAERFLERNTPPYPYLQPFTARDRLRFCGRDGEIRLALSRLGASRLLVLYGPAGVGKTSLLAAGLIPQLAEDGALAVHVRDYAQPLSETLTKALSASQEQLELPLRQGASLPELLQAVQQTTHGTLVLVLDQFETLFHPDFPAELRLAQINALVESLKAVPPEYLRLVLAVREDQLLRLSDLQEALPDLFRSFMELKPLTRNQARQAVLQPNQVVAQPLFYADGMVDELLLPELDALTRDDPDAIFPPHLQIVCRWLYDQAQQRGLRMVTPELYLQQGRGAEGILVSHLDETLRTRLADRSQLAEQALAALAALGEGAWASAQALYLPGAAQNEVVETLDQLAEAGFLLSMRAVGEPGQEAAAQYSFASEALLQAVEQRHSAEIEPITQGRRELPRLWAGWKASSELPTPRQVVRLQAAMPRLAPEPLHALLLLRAAAAARLPCAPWIAPLYTAQGRALIAELEGLPPVEHTLPFTPTDLLEAGRILELPQPRAGNPPGAESPAPSAGANASAPYGRLAAAAAQGNLAAARQAAALALLAYDPYQAIDRLGWALDPLPGAARLARQAELSGAMLEASPAAASPLSGRLSRIEWLAAWMWRLAYRSRTLGSSLLGAAIGGGLAFAGMRFLTASLARYTPELHALLNFNLGALISGGMVLGLEISRWLPAPAPTPTGAVPGADAPDATADPAKPQREAPHPLISAGLGALSGWLGYTAAYFSVGGARVAQKNAILLLGLVLVSGLSLALALPQWRAYPPRRPYLRILAAAAWSALLTIALIASGMIHLSPAGFWSALVYQANINTPANQFWLSGLVRLLPHTWFILLAVLDAALAGGLLVAGLLAGLRFAGRADRSP